MPDIDFKLDHRLRKVLGDKIAQRLIDVCQSIGSDGSATISSITPTGGTLTVTGNATFESTTITFGASGEWGAISTAGLVMASAKGITLSGNAELLLSGGSDLTFSGTNDSNRINVTDNLAISLAVKIPSGNDLLRFQTTDSDERVISVAAFQPTAGILSAIGESPRLIHTGGAPATSTSFGTNTTDVVDGTVYLAEVEVPCNKTVTGVAVFNGTAVAGNGKVMLYDSTGARLAISASTAMSGPEAYQSIAFTAPVAIVGPGRYFIGVIFNTTTHDLRGHTLGAFATGTDAGNTYATDSTFATVTVPTTFTTAVGPVASLY